MKNEVNITIRDDVMKETKFCKKLRCVNACDELTVNYHANFGYLADDQYQNQSWLIASWPSYDGVPVFKEIPEYTNEELLSQWGGIAGLWLGASMMSFFEIFYYFCCCWRNSGEEEEVVTKL